MKLKEVSIELAKKLKEKGFNEYCHKYYDTPSCRKVITKSNSMLKDGEYSAPSLELVKMWFLEQKILIEVNPCDSWEEWHFQIIAEDSMAPFYVFTSGGENG